MSFLLSVAVTLTGSETLQGQQTFVPADAEFTMFDVVGSKAFVIGPRTHNEDKAQPWVWYTPTIFSKGVPGKTQLWIFSELIAQGVSIAGVDVGESYGAPSGTDVYDKFYGIVTRGLKLESGKQILLNPRPCFLAQSRGGLMAYAWAIKRTAEVKCIAGIYPVVNLVSWPISHSPDQVPEASRAYGLSETEFRTRAESLSPISHLQPLANARIPILHLHGSEDRAVPSNENSEIVRQRYATMGAPMRLIVVPGKGHQEADEFFRSGQLLVFLLKQLTPISVCAP